MTSLFTSRDKYATNENVVELENRGPEPDRREPGRPPAETDGCVEKLPQRTKADDIRCGRTLRGQNRTRRQHKGSFF